MKKAFSSIILVLILFLTAPSVKAQIVEVSNGRVNCVNTCANIGQASGANDFSITSEVKNATVSFTISPNEYFLEKSRKFCFVVGWNSTDKTANYCTPISLDKNSNRSIQLKFRSSGQFDALILDQKFLSESGGQSSNVDEFIIDGIAVPTPTTKPTGLQCSDTLNDCCDINTGKDFISDNQLCDGYYCVRSSAGSQCESAGGGFISDQAANDYLAKIKFNVDQAAAGSIGGSCVAGDLELNGLPPPDISGDVPSSEGLGNKIKGILGSLAEKISEFTKPGMQYFGFIKTSAVTTNFCPIDKEVAIPIFSEEGQSIVFTPQQTQAAWIAVQKLQGSEELTLSILNSELNNLLKDNEESSPQFTEGHVRVLKAQRLLTSTANMNLDDKNNALKQIQTILARKGADPSISCKCESRQELQKKWLDENNGNVQGVNTSAGGSVLPASSPPVSIEGICGAVFLTPTPAPGAPSLGTRYVTCVQDIEDFCSKYNPNYVSCARTLIDKCGAGDINCILTSIKYISTAKNTCDPLYNINQKEYTKCVDCGLFNAGVWTSVGCIYSDFSKTVERLFAIALGLGGLIALGCIIYASYIMQTSAGNPEKTKKAQELITSCIAGLILIIFSVFILKVIGVDILRIPGLG